MKKKVSEEKNEQNEPIMAEQATTAEQNTPSGDCTSENSEKGDESAKIDALNQEIEDLKDKNLRLMAEFDNFRKRTLKEKSELILNGGEDVLKKLLPLVDDFERALKAMETSTDATALKEGLDLIYTKLIGYLNENGVQAIPTENEIFNTDLHEAITTFPAPTEELKGKIIDCVSKGYTLREKVIRYSKVVVGE
jgi:molecular chaperone GrpE